MNVHEKYMRIALDLAKSAYENGDEPFGAILVKEDVVVAKSENRIVSSSDPTLHAELALISDFTRANNTRDLSEYTMYTSCEPCFMCCGAIVWSKIKKVVCSAKSNDLAKILNEKEFSSSDIIFSHYEGIEVIKNVLHEEGLEVLKLLF